MFNIFKNIALFFVLPTCRGSLTNVDANPFHVSATNAPSSFEFYNEICEAHCVGKSLNDSDFIINPCPKCLGKYAHEHCNNCCSGGSSSLKIRWHGCGSVFTSPTSAEVNSRCSGSYDNSSDRRVKFVDCDCYDSILIGIGTDGCNLLDEMSMDSSEENGEIDICVVSVVEVQGIYRNEKEWKIDLSTPLPNPLILKQTAPSNTDYDAKGVDFNYFPFVTFFDTSCNSSTNQDFEGVLPLFPGYGKFPNSCGDEGFIDMELQDLPRLPDAINFFNGIPLKELFWFEFVDGSSASFWPSSNNVSDALFNPSFAVCSCMECPTHSPSMNPSNTPTLAISVQPSTKSPTRPPSRVQKQCKKSQYEECTVFSTTRCTYNGDECEWHGTFDSENDARKLRSLEKIVALVEGREVTTWQNMSHIMYYGEALTRKVVEAKRSYHSKEIQRLNSVSISTHFNN